jgi:hypothetical protein
MENIMGEEVSVFEGLNYRHQMLLEKLWDLNKRLHISTVSLGGEYPLKASKDSDSSTEGNHINNYVNQLDNMEGLLTEMFNHIEVLENLVRK